MLKSYNMVPYWDSRTALIVALGETEMADATLSREVRNGPRRHPFGAHGVLLALPLSIALWTLIALPFL